MPCLLLLNRRPNLARPYGLAKSSADDNNNGAQARIQTASAQEAAAWVTGSPQYEKEWPACGGKCLDGYCALPWDHPACCYVPSEYDGDEYESRGRPYAAAVNPDGSVEGTTLAGYWQSKNFFCWR